MADDIDILTYAGFWFGALLLTVILGAVVALLVNLRRKKKNEAR